MLNTKYFLYRRGNGNEGNNPRICVAVGHTKDAHEILKTLVLNDFVGRTGQHISQNLELNDDSSHPTLVVHEGPSGGTAFGKAWLTAELQPLTKDQYYSAVIPKHLISA